eukprot:CAMPEP_0184306164 /NCGR_PEP_ID=MMETSP1049-20130417/15230_1 /TAXON_ID=77928 /ORGANISM="Proteomonas sulcata, Strain CCMP704" /LENGTH=81 /DNA_ID=CAMNT_0026618365 /DNA_START=1239 /DNA_END=1484 /DNA_ORIENTATION=-
MTPGAATAPLVAITIESRTTGRASLHGLRSFAGRPSVPWAPPPAGDRAPPTGWESTRAVLADGALLASRKNQGAELPCPTG